MNDSEATRPELSWLPATFAAFRHKNFRLYWFGQFVSFIGTWMQNTAKGWLVLTLTNSPFLVGLDSAMTWLPAWLVSLPAGVFADRFSKRNLMLFTQSALALLALILAILTWTRVVTIYHILIISCLSGFVVALNSPVAQSLIPELVGRKDVLNAIALNSSLFNAGRIIGPAIAGALLTFTSPGTCFGINAASFLAIIIALHFIRLETADSARVHGSVWQSISSGLNFVRSHPDIRLLILMIAVFSSLGIVYIPMMPVFARDVFLAGSRGYGLLMSALGVGALAGGLFLATISKTAHKGRLLLLGTMLLGLLLFLFSALRSLWAAVALLGLIGFCQTSIASLTNTLVQTLSPDNLRGRVMSIYMLCFNGMFPIGALIAGSIAQRCGAPAATLVGGAGVLASLLVLYLIRPQLSRL
ncbi:MAG: MFS transporter [candidate division WOR-3 bacterium]